MALKLVNGEVVDDELPSVRVSFYEDAVLVGKGKYEARDFITVKGVGSRDYVSRRATDEDKRNYPTEWERYQEGKTVIDAGLTPLKGFPGCKTAFLLELASMQITTVEDLATCETCPIEGLEELYKRARAFVKSMEEINEELQAESGAEGQQDHDLRGCEDSGNAGCEGRGQRIVA